MTYRKAREDSAVTRENGRPTLYDHALCALATDYCMLGATLEEVARLLGVSYPTLLAWRRKHPEFEQAILEGRELADARVAKSLYRRAIGYSHPDLHICVIDGEVVQTPTVKHYPPDTAAAFIWLQNRRRGDWKNRRDVLEDTSPEEVALLAQQAIARAMATLPEQHGAPKAQAGDA